MDQSQSVDSSESLLMNKVVRREAHVVTRRMVAMLLIVALSHAQANEAHGSMGSLRNLRCISCSTLLDNRDAVVAGATPDFAFVGVRTPSSSVFDAMSAAAVDVYALRVDTSDVTPLSALLSDGLAALASDQIILRHSAESLTAYLLAVRQQPSDEHAGGGHPIAERTVCRIGPVPGQCVDLLADSELSIAVVSYKYDTFIGDDESVILINGCVPRHPDVSNLGHVAEVTSSTGLVRRRPSDDACGVPLMGVMSNNEACSYFLFAGRDKGFPNLNRLGLYRGSPGSVNVTHEDCADDLLSSMEPWTIDLAGCSDDGRYVFITGRERGDVEGHVGRPLVSRVDCKAAEVMILEGTYSELGDAENKRPVRRPRQVGLAHHGDFVILAEENEASWGAIGLPYGGMWAWCPLTGSVCVLAEWRNAVPQERISWQPLVSADDTRLLFSSRDALTSDDGDKNIDTYLAVLPTELCASGR